MFSNISFADASLLSFSYEGEKNSVLNVVLESWNEKIIKITFEDVLFLEFSPGDFVSEIYKCNEESSILCEALKKEYGNIPAHHEYQLILINDIDDNSILKIVNKRYVISVHESKI